MANPEHVKLLQEGVARWNALRAENPEVNVDLGDVDFPYGVNLNGVNLSRTFGGQVYV